MHSGGTDPAEIDSLSIEISLFQGWPVVIPDHEGRKSIYLANFHAALAILERFRAITAYLRQYRFSQPRSCGDLLEGALLVPQQQGFSASVHQSSRSLVSAVKNGVYARFFSAVNSRSYSIVPVYERVDAEAAQARKCNEVPYQRNACLSSIIETFVFQNILNYFHDATKFHTSPEVV